MPALDLFGKNNRVRPGACKAAGVDWFCGRSPTSAVRTLASDTQFMLKLLHEMPGVSVVHPVVQSTIVALAYDRQG
jgi:hypothetical protein